MPEMKLSRESLFFQKTFHSHNLLLGKLRSVLFLAELADLFKLASFDALYLHAIFCQLVAHSLTFFKVVKAVLLLHLRVLHDLLSKIGG